MRLVFDRQAVAGFESPVAHVQLTAGGLQPQTATGCQLVGDLVSRIQARRVDTRVLLQVDRGVGLRTGDLVKLPGSFAIRIGVCA